MQTAMPERIERLTFDVQDGALSVLAAGPVTGDRIVLLHGIPTNANLFRAVLPILARAGYRAFAPDMPGYGESRLAEGADYSLSAVASRYAAWLDAERLAPVWLIGHDLGVVLAALLAVRFPRLCSHLTLGNGPTPDSFPVLSVKISIWAARIGLLLPLVRLGLVPNPYLNREVRRGFGDPARLTDDMWRTVFWDGKVRDPRGIAEFARHLKQLGNREAADVFPGLAQLSVPTLVLWSEADRYQPADTSGKRILASLPSGTAYQSIDGAGHFLPLEAPIAYAETLLAWRRQHHRG